MANVESGSFYLRWKSHCKNAPSSSMIRGSAAVNGTIAYFNSATSKAIYGYDTVSEMWFSLPNCPQQCFALVVLRGALTAVGGFCRIQATNKLQTLIEKDTRGSATWTDSMYPAMPTMRGRVAAVSTEDYLVVAGGQLAVVTEIGGVLRRVEIMDINTQQWFNACSLPYELTEPSMTLCGSRLYIMGGWASNDRTKSVLSCDLQVLVKSHTAARSVSPVSPGATARLENSVWNEVADIPIYASTALTVNGDILLGIGGCDEKESPSDSIYWYNPKANLWSCVGHMEKKRFRALAAVLPGDKPQLMVIGGSSSADGTLSGKGEIAELVMPS